MIVKAIYRHTILCVVLFIGSGDIALSTEINLIMSQGGIYTVPVRINGVITLSFVIDSGASDVQIPADVVITLMRTGTINAEDFLPGQIYQMADGSTVKSERFILRHLELSDHRIDNVPASVGGVQGQLLLGQSLLGRFSSWSLDNQRHVLVLSDSILPVLKSVPQTSNQSIQHTTSHQSNSPPSTNQSIQMAAIGNDPVSLVKAYYECLSRGDADFAVQFWASPNEKKLRSAIASVESFHLEDAHLQTIQGNRASVWVSLIGKKKGEMPERWIGSIDLIKNPKGWRIATLKNVTIQE